VGQAVRGQLRQAAGLAGVTVAAVAAASPFIVSHWFRGHWYMFAALLVGLAATWASFLIRGILAGLQDFKFFTVTLVVEGMARIVPSLLLTMLGAGSVWAFGLVFALGPLVAAASGLLAPSLRDGWSSAAAASGDALPQSGDSDRTKMTLLTLAVLVSQLVMNAVPIVVIPWLSADGPPGLGTSVGSAMGLSRLALLCLIPLQAPLLPLMASAAARGDMADVRKKTRFLAVACLGAGALGVVVSLIAGPWLLTSYLATPAPLSRAFLAGMAAGTAFLMTAFVLQAAQVALNRHRIVLVAWTLGLASMGLVFALPVTALDAAVWAGIVGPLVVTGVMVVDMLLATRTRPDSAGPATAEAVGAASTLAVTAVTAATAVAE
jgi:O-antigen/teichoic acid export membrane protein